MSLTACRALKDWPGCHTCHVDSMLTSGKIGDGSQHFWGCVWVLLTCVVDSASVSGALVDVVRSGCRMEGHAMPTVASSENKGNRAHILQYEQLLSIQQDQCLPHLGLSGPHALAMERKDAEVAHLKVRLAALEARSSVFAESWTSAFGQGHLAPQDAVATAVQTKDEECALMMAAKHKETRSRRGPRLEARHHYLEAIRQVDLMLLRVSMEDRKQSRTPPMYVKKTSSLDITFQWYVDLASQVDITGKLKGFRVCLVAIPEKQKLAGHTDSVAAMFCGSGRIRAAAAQASITEQQVLENEIQQNTADKRWHQREWFGPLLAITGQELHRQGPLLR
ncbi:hypothetical protein AK812_SmicGene9633 [Symbiodinium microadriaticum]|uniref:Uncharacterized protein n=1 Tax=Symbiodinium microadriaticum TaxID=2951 RepID=A0A1Q9EHR5_SYMMI|nr:hypothetical protein AK812_SmicGene9633 [Symbiodinium microadriaticum]